MANQHGTECRCGACAVTLRAQLAEAVELLNCLTSFKLDPRALDAINAFLSKAAPHA